MAEIDQNVLELVERRIAERVADNVERALKWRYGIVLVVFTAVATMFGWSIKSSIDAEIDTVVAESSDKVDAEIQRLVGKAQESSRQAEISFGIASNVGQRVMSNMDVVEKRVVDFDAKLKILAELEGRVDGVGKKLDDLGAQSDARLAKLALNLDDVGRIRGIDANLSALAEQVAVLQTVVRNVAAAAKAEPVPGPSYAEARSAVENIVAQSSQRNESFAKAAGEPVTVFFQFAGGQRQQAAALSKELRDAGFQVPGEERTTGAAGQHQVRYFHDGDADSAQALVTAANAALQQLGYDATAVTMKDFRDYPKLKPREGTLELWLELPPRQSAS